MRGLALAADQLLQRSGPDAMFMTGGDTAAAMLKQLNASGLMLNTELLPE